MDAVTYSKTDVVGFIEENFVAVLLPFDVQPYAADFHVKWTPTLITLSPEGREHHRTVGFLGPEELVPSLLLGKGKVYFDADRFGDALASLERVEKDYPQSDSAPEALYLAGVCRYKNSHDPKPLKEAYEKLSAVFPGNEWTKRASPYGLL